VRTTDPKALIRRLVQEVWNEGRADAVPDYFAPGLREEVARHHAELLGAFSELKVDIDGLVADGDRVAARLTVSGRHDRGAFAGQPPSGKRLTSGSFRFYRIEGGRVAQTWAMQDRLSLMQQLGALSAPEAGVSWADGSDR
jgi:predicted ester cyclase